MANRRRSALLAALGALLLVPGARPGSALEGLAGRVEEMVLENGMRFLFVPRGDAPVFHGLIRFHVGGVDEVPGITGLAHLFEHMAFKGTPVIGTKDHQGEKLVLEEIDRRARDLSAEEAKGILADERRVEVMKAQLKALQELHKKYVVKDEFTMVYTQNGGDSLNATTSKDFTTYFLSLPANKLELWMLMESERLLNPVMREFYSERDVVQEERRMRTDDDPGGKLYEQFVATAFSAHPYRFPTVGWSSDIKTVTMKEAQEFYDAYYSPRNSVAALVGRFDVAAAKRWAKRYFGRLSNKGTIQRPRTQEPEQVGERRVTVAFDANPDMMVGWHKPTLPHPDAYVFEVLEKLLAEGRTSRLYRRLVETRKAQGVWSYTVPGTRYPNVFVISATPLAGHTLEAMEAGIEEELAVLRRDLVDPAEIAKVVRQTEAEFLWSLDSNQGMADVLTRFQLLTGSWKSVIEYLDELGKVTPERVRAAVQKYLRPEARTVGWLVKKPPAEGAAKGGE